MSTSSVLFSGTRHGLAAGAAGVVAMTVSEKLEQRLTRRPNSQVPGRVLTRLVPRVSAVPVAAATLSLHVGQGVVVGSIRGVMAEVGLRGPWSSAMFTVIRLTTDQVLENATGVGAPPWTWPRQELAVDLLHKTVYAFATGWVADLLARRVRKPGPGQRHACPAGSAASGTCEGATQ